MSYRLAILAIALIGVALRTAAAFAMAKGDPRLWFFGQASELGCLAESVIAGHGLGSPFCGATGPSAFLAPGYPLLVALAFQIFGTYSRGAATMLIACQILFGTLMVPVIASVAKRMFGAKTALVTATLCAMSPALVFLSTVFWETSLSSLLLTSTLALALRRRCARNRLRWGAMGLLCGAATQVNPALVLALGAILLWAARTSVGPWTSSMIGFLVWGVLFAAWPIRNQLVLHTFIPLRSNLGYELWQGNRPGSNGNFSPELHPNVNRLQRERYAQLGEVAYMNEKLVLAKSEIEAQPMRFVEHSIVRIARFWSGATNGAGATLLRANITLTSILTVISIFFLARRRSVDVVLVALPFLLFPLPYYITHADVRFRLVLEPLAIMLSVYAVRRSYVLAAD